MMKKIFVGLSIVLAVSALSGCAKTTFTESTHAIANTQQKIQTIQQQAATTAPAVVVRSGYYVNTNPVSLQQTPAWLRQPVSLQANNIPLNILMGRLLRNSDVAASYDKSVNPLTRVSLDYNGNVQGALRALAAVTHLAFTVGNQTVTWSAFMTRTFNIAFMPGSANYSVGRSQTGIENDDTNLSSTGSASVGGLNDSQYSNLSGNLSVWHDLSRTLNELKSPQGRVVVSESTTSVTVHDHPQNVQLMARYIKQLNKSLSQQVGIRVQVLSIQLSKEYNFGIDWNVVGKELGTKFSLSAPLATAANTSASDIISDNNNSGLSMFQIGSNEGNALLQALDEQGKLRVVTKPEVVTMNNQIASIRITQNTGYIQSVSSSFAGDNGSVLTSTITPGTVTDGFTLYVLPKIEGENVYMQISSTISDLLSLQKESNAPDSSSTSTTNQNNTGFSAIEVPTIAQKSFNQRSMVQSGHTLVIAGYKRLRNQTQSNSLFGVKPLGGKGAQSQNVETLVLITPVIMRNS